VTFDVTVLISYEQSIDFKCSVFINNLGSVILLNIDVVGNRLFKLKLVNQKLTNTYLQ